MAGSYTVWTMWNKFFHQLYYRKSVETNVPLWFL